MMSPVQQVLGGFNTLFGGATFYDGPDLNVVFDNGTTRNTSWYAIYNPGYYTGPLTTGGDYYNFFVLGNYPESFYNTSTPCGFTPQGCSNETVDTNDTNQPSFAAGWDEYTGGQYPAAQVVQHNLKDLGWVTGYYLDDISTGVLSLPSFDETGWAISNFSTTVYDFIHGAQERSTSKIIIDVQGNSGGAILLALTTFYAFFPEREPFAGSRRRSHPLADVLGSTLTNGWESNPTAQGDFSVSASSEWVVTDRLNAETTRNFTSWDEYSGPREEMGDLFSLVVSFAE